MIKREKNVFNEGDIFIAVKLTLSNNITKLSHTEKCEGAWIYYYRDIYGHKQIF